MTDTSGLQFPDGKSMDDIIRAMREPRAPIGTRDNPYVLVVPRWYEDRCIAEGTTAQAVADATLMYPTRVDVMEDYL